MEAVYELLRNEFRLFGTAGISLVLVCAAIMFGIVEKKRLGDRIGLFFKYEILMLLLLGNPFTYNNISTFWMGDSYWKMFFLLLPGICIAVPIVEFTMGQKRIWAGALAFLACVGVIAVSMSFTFSKEIKCAIPENSYKVEQEIVEVDEILRESGRSVRNMIAPREICVQIREIDPGANLLYGEDLIERIIAGEAAVEDEAEQRFIDMCTTVIAVPAALDHQLLVADTYGSTCILLEASYDDADQMEQGGFEYYGRTENYTVYFRK